MLRIFSKENKLKFLNYLKNISRTTSARSINPKVLSSWIELTTPWYFTGEAGFSKRIVRATKFPLRAMVAIWKLTLSPAATVIIIKKNIYFWNFFVKINWEKARYFQKTLQIILLPFWQLSSQSVVKSKGKIALSQSEVSKIQTSLLA